MPGKATYDLTWSFPIKLQPLELYPPGIDYTDNLFDLNLTSFTFDIYIEWYQKMNHYVFYSTMDTLKASTYFRFDIRIYIQ